MPDTVPATPAPRGTLKFQVTAAGNLQNSATNVNLLRQMWADRAVIDGDNLGPGDPGDFDFGAWHSSCHLLGAGGVMRTADGRILWLEVSHLRTRDEYFASVTVNGKNGAETVPLDSAAGRELIDNATLLGFVEGNSIGRASARLVFDAPDRFNLWRRQDFDQPVTIDIEGGKVWEHWCTLRDLRPTNRLGLSVLTAYVSLVSALGDRFAAAVMRGRRDYAHPTQLCAMVHFGFVGEKSAVSELAPTAIPAAQEALLLDAEPGSALAAVEKFDWAKPPKYFMFARRIKSWSSAKAVKDDLKKFRPPR